MKKGDTITGRVVAYDFPNIGTVEVNDGEEKVLVKVKNAIIGQTVEGTVNKKKHNLLEARLERVTERSECEIDSPCPHFGVCGGCLYQTFPYEEQLKIKEKQVYSLIEKAISGKEPNLNDKYEGIIGSPNAEGYRNKMEYSFGDEYKDGPLALGLHKRGSTYDIVNTPYCRIADEDFGRILQATLDYFSGLNIPYFHKMRHEGILRHLCVRKGGKSGEMLVFLVTSSAWKEKYTENEWKEILEGWKNKILEIGINDRLTGILYVKNDSFADAVIDEGTTILYGKDFFEEELLGLDFRISPFSFFQNNSLGAEILYGKVRDYLLEDMSYKPVVYDLYTGTGTIAQLVSPAAGRVIGVEIVAEAVEAAKESAKRNGLTNCEFIAGDVLKVIDDIETKPDYIILDPPRDGINPKALEKIIDYGVERMVYVSCKPTSLARDLVMLYEKGYEIKKMCMVDMFPQTGHVETVCLLSKLHEAKHHVNVNLDMAAVR